MDPILPSDHPLRPALTHLLGQYIAECSESWRCSGWHAGAEEDIPRELRRLARKGCRGPIHACAVADALGHWANYCEAGIDEYVPYVPACDREEKP